MFCSHVGALGPPRLIINVGHEMIRTAIAFAVAPLIAAILVMPSGGPILSLMLSYGVSYIFGVPVFLALRHLQQERHLYYAGAGFALGIVYALCTGAVSGTVGDLLTVGTIFGLLGLLVGLSFSLIRGGERRMSPTMRSSE